MRFKCLVFDHDDTVVNSTATIHYPSFVDYLRLYRPGMDCSLEDYFLKNFHPGFLEMCREDYGLTERELAEEERFWREYVRTRIPTAYPGMKELMERHIARGGRICVVSHSYADNIRRDWAANALPAPELVFGWEQPPERRKPSPWPLKEIMRRLGLKAEELLMIDDLKPGYDMAAKCGVAFAGVGWSNDLEPIETFMRQNCQVYFKTVAELGAYLEENEV